MFDGHSMSWLEQLRDRFISQGQQPSDAHTAQPVPRKLGLALGGGGGKGTAHVGVLRVLKALEIPIDLIAGTSAGGAVAVFYAAGIDLDEIPEIFRKLAIRNIFVPDPTRTGLIGQKRREAVLTQVLGDRTFADLSIPCALTAVDLVTGTPVVIDEGSLVEAVLATTAVPGILPPVIRDDLVLADGGILNNLPVDVAQRYGAQRVIAVELNDAVPGFSLIPAMTDNPLARMMLAPQQFTVATRALSLLMNHSTALQLRENPPDLLISPEVADIPTLDLTNPEKGLEQGIAAASVLTDQLLALRSWRLDDPEPAPEPASEPAIPWLNLPFALPRWGETAPPNGDQHRR
jgi:NTE family protein